MASDSFPRHSPIEMEEPIESLGDFVKATDLMVLLSRFVLFRGQPVAGNLLPNIARGAPEKDTSETERQLLQQLKLQGASFIDASSTDLDILILAQHFGLKTRLLDWTSNPLVALWFACVDKTSDVEDVFVYALVTDGMFEEDAYEEDPLKLPKTVVIQPRHNNARLIAQHGWFTLHRYSQSSKRFVALEKNRETSGLLCYRVLGKSRPEIIKSLDRHGINARTVFPDIQGLCQHLNWQLDEDMPLSPYRRPLPDD